ncbi:unnamed protein product [Eruca vesicaria subsp. sativa]|uniref:Ubiquitin carboxyl-terminal hydrolase n=1 Tax=Eruca vesicaria subsp. sativa TaxID=29727 RepID=A0ABC8L743_ERUVS|nr:unnamed protein product [Eruca vesicaria subsp. sativa]
METLNPCSANKRRFSSPSSKRSDGSDHALDLELTFSRTIRKIGAGLENLGNTCFLNSVVQCLTYTEPLAAYLQDVGHEKRCHVAGFCALCAMQKHVRLALQASGRIVAPKYLVSNLRCVSRNFRNCRQEDAHEYMINLLECMHRCCLPTGVPTESSDAYRSSLVHKIFGGSLRSQVKCAQCSHCSDKFDPFLDLSLDISKADSLQRALSRFTAAELLDDGAKIYHCERCKQKVKAVKQLTVSKAPYVLTVHLKRFEAHRSGKIDKKVEFASAIDMKPFVSGPYAGDLKYTLYGVLVHYGRSSHSGHYACFVRTSSGMWYSLDDNRVIQVSEKTVFNQKAYMLFYVRDRQTPSPKKTVAVVKKETSKESIATNRSSLNIFSKSNDQVDGSAAVMKASSSNALVANGTVPPMRSGAPAVLAQKDLNGQKDPPSSIEAKEILKRENGTDRGAPTALAQKNLNAKDTQNELASSVEAKEILKRANGSVPLRSCAPAVLTQKDLNAKETQKDPPSSVDAAKEIFKRENGSTPLKPCDIRAPAVLTQKDLNTKEILRKEVPLPEKPATSIESVKASCDEGTLSTPRKTRKGNMKTLQVVGLKSFKLTLLGVRKKKKQKKGRSSTTLAVKLKKDKRVNHRNGNMLQLGSPPAVELKERRSNQNGAILASDQQQPLRSSEGSQNAKRKRGELSKEEQVTTILTRGLPETMVSKLDEEVVSVSKMRKSEEDSIIGYVADERDEEYDRGKKKKIMMKEERSNTFQLIASKKQQTETKKKWMNTAKTGFRI